MRIIVIWGLEHWLIFAVVLSAFSGVQAAALFTPKEFRGMQKWLTRWYQFWLNLVCSFAGWVAIHIMYVRYSTGGAQLNNELLCLFLIALLGITGHLAELIHGAAGFLKGRVPKV